MQETFNVIDVASGLTVGIGKPMQVSDFDHIMATIASSACTCKVRFQGSLQKQCPDFSAAKTIANQWDYIKVVDLQDNSAITGDTGITLTASTDVQNYEVNVNGLVWLCVEISGSAAGGLQIPIFARKIC